MSAFQPPVVEPAPVSIVRQVDGVPVVVRGTLLAQQPSAVVVEVPADTVLPSGQALSVVVHTTVPRVVLATASPGDQQSVVTLRLYERRA